MDDPPACVIDIGSSFVRAGYAGDDAPRYVFPTLFGKPKYPKVMIDPNHKDEFIGDEAYDKKGVLKLHYPIQNGITSDWDVMEKLLCHTYYKEYRIAPEDQPALLTEPPLNPKHNREKMTELMFETINVPKFYISLQAILGVYASGRGCAMLLDIGEGVTHMLPVFEGYTVRESITRYNFGGRDITQCLANMLNQRGHSFFTTAEMEIVKTIKESLCYVASKDINWESEESKKKNFEQSFELPDGQVIQVGEERFASPEILFSPFLAGYPFPGIHEMLDTALSKCEMDMRRILYGNIVLSGGGTMFPGLQERLNREISILAPHHKVRVIAPIERKYSTWIGGSILASLSTFQSYWITRQDYDEAGPSIVHRKCL